MYYMYTCIHVPLIYIFYSIAIYRSFLCLFGAALRYDITYGDWERRNERKRKRESNKSTNKKLSGFFIFQMLLFAEFQLP